MVRTTKASLEAENRTLRAENEQLKVELECLRARSHSPRRNQRTRSRSPRQLQWETSACAALGQVQRNFLRDPALAEQGAIILRQQQEIAALRRGEGPVGEVLLTLWEDVTVDDFVRSRCAERTETVANYLRRLRHLTSVTADLTTWGKSYWEKDGTVEMPKRGHVTSLAG